jgi:hypothetical protein
MCEFTHYGQSTQFNNAIRSNLSTLPIIGDPAPTKILALIHYSKDDQIRAFRSSAIHSWTDKVSENYEMVGKITGLTGITFKAMYLIRVGFGSSYAPRNYSCQFVSEWALDIHVKSDEFAKIMLSFDQCRGDYRPIEPFVQVNGSA